MKNKRCYKYWLSSLGEVATAGLLTYIILIVANKILTYLYLNTKIQLINYIFKLRRIINVEIFEGANYVIIGTLLFAGLYLLITYRKTKNLTAIIDQTEIMASGDLDRLIEVNGKNDIKNLAENINNILRQLKEITIVERKTQQTKNQKEDIRMDENSLSHTRWNCKYHIVFIPKYRRKAIYGKLRQDIGQIVRQLCKYKNVEIIEAHTCVDHIHMLVSIPPKLSVSSFIGYLKGKSSLMIYDRHANLKYKHGNRHFWAKGYFVSTVGLNKATIAKYIREQEDEDKMLDSMTTKEYEDSFKGC